MQSNPIKKIIFDANAIIDLHRYGLWKQVINACHAVVTPIIKREARFYKDGLGVKRPIQLDLDIKNKKVEEITVPIDEFLHLKLVLSDFFLQSIDEGEWEAIAFLYNSGQKHGYLFCTADMLAIKCLGVLGLRYQGISMQELFEKLRINTNVPGRYIQTHSKEIFEKMLNEGFLESHLYKK